MPLATTQIRHTAQTPSPARVVAEPDTSAPSEATPIVCPLTGGVPVDPVIAADGRTYERSALVAHLDAQHQLPDSEHPATEASVYPDRWTMAFREASAAELSADEPDALCDPITCAVMSDPHTASDGYTYDLSTLEQICSEGNGCSPFTREPFERGAYRHVGVRRELASRGFEVAPIEERATELVRSERIREAEWRARIAAEREAHRAEARALTLDDVIANPDTVLRLLEEVPDTMLTVLRSHPAMEREMDVRLGGEYWEARRAARRSVPRLRGQRRSENMVAWVGGTTGLMIASLASGGILLPFAVFGGGIAGRAALAAARTSRRPLRYARRQIRRLHDRARGRRRQQQAPEPAA